MEDELNPNAAPTAPAPVPAKKPRKPRTPKVKPPKKERVLLGGIVLCRKTIVDGFMPLETQPPADIANDVTKVERWAEGQELLSKVAGPIHMIRQYNAVLSVKSSIKLEAKIEFIKEEEPKKQETV